MGAHRKGAVVAAETPDVAVIAECAHPRLLAERARPGQVSVADRATSWVWMGSNENKGLLVASYGDTHLSGPHNANGNLAWICPVRVRHGDATWELVAVWEVADRRTRPERPYGALRGWLDDWAPNRNGNLIVAGDFNYNPSVGYCAAADAAGTSLPDALAGFGLASAYHRHTGAAHGREPDDTFAMWRKPQFGFHVDYIFTNTPTSDVRVGPWSASLPSDHRPVSAVVGVRSSHRRNVGAVVPGNG